MMRCPRIFHAHHPARLAAPVLAVLAALALGVFGGPAPSPVRGARVTGAEKRAAPPATAGDSIYAAHHPRLLFDRSEVPALAERVTDGAGRDDIGFARCRTLFRDVYPTMTLDELLSHDSGVGEIPVLGVLAWLSPGPDTADSAAALGKALVLRSVQTTAPDDNVFFSPLRLRQLALGYDLFFDAAADSTRGVVRAEIETYIDTILTVHHYERWLYRPYLSNISALIASALGTAAITLDGETDPARIAAALALADRYIDAWLAYLLDPEGAYNEGVMYAGFSLRHLCVYFEARRRYDGTDYSTRPGIREVLGWLAYETLPTAPAELNNLNDAATLNYPWSRHHAFLDWAQHTWQSPLAAWLWARIAGPALGHDSGRLADPGLTALWGGAVAAESPSLTLPRHFLWRGRGLYTYRTGWPSGARSDDVVFTLYAGKFQGGHSQEDQGGFTLYGYGARWAIDHGFLAPGRESEAHNMVFVDGKGQHHAGGSFGTDGRIASDVLGVFGDYLMADLTDAYTTYSEFNRPGVPFPDDDWSAGYDGGNPVVYAHRRAFVVHGAGVPPYVLLDDDVVKDASAHTYSWRMHTDDAHAVTGLSNPIMMADTIGSCMNVYIAAPETSAIDYTLQGFDNLHDDPNSVIVSLSQTAPRGRFALALVPAASPAALPAVACDTTGAGEALVFRWPAGATDVVLFNRGIGVHGYDAAAAGAPPAQPITTDARVAVARFASGVRGYMGAELSFLEVGGVVLARVTDGRLDVSVAAGLGGAPDTIDVGRADAAFRFYAPGGAIVRFRAAALPTLRDGDYVVADRVSGGRGGPNPPGGVSVRTYPNPFNGSATIRVVTRPGARFSVAVYDAVGRPVRSLGAHTSRSGMMMLRWDGRNDRGGTVTSGVYLVRVRTGDTVGASKIVVVR